jgi:2-oxoglutarate ferredoxin oxidoreductase subunit delta
MLVSLGSTQAPVRGGVIVAKGRVAIVVERCKACGFCVEFCPTKVLALSSAFNSKGYHPPHVVAPDKCSGCDLCGMYCPDFAIYGYKNAVPKSEEPKAEAKEVSHEG